MRITFQPDALVKISFSVSSNASYALKYNLMPYVGLLRYGEVARLSDVPFEVREEL